MQHSSYGKYIVVKTTESFFEIYTKNDDEQFRSYIGRWMVLDDNARVERPSLNWPTAARSSDGKTVHVPKLIVRFVFSKYESASAFVLPAKAESEEFIILGIGADPGAIAADHWCPVAPNQLGFGRRKQARQQIGADLLGQSPFSGSNVNVVIADRGLNKEEIENRFGAGRYGDGWPYIPQPGSPYPQQLPGTATDTAHGLMLARNILDIAPEAVLWDLPILPPRIFAIGPYLSDVHAAYISMLNDITQRGGTWVLVNAWAIFDRSSEAPLGGYTENLPSPAILHPFTQEIAGAIDDNHDIIFCAGNCGEFCPDQRCGANDRGAGRSIWGANSFYRVLTVSSVRVDGEWIGYSSQGPGQPNLASPAQPGFCPKPDLCTPSGFFEDMDAHTVNAGTSASTGVAAGVVAALRSALPPQAVKPEMLYQAMKATARQPLSGGWNQRFGNGILNIPRVLAMLQ